MITTNGRERILGYLADTKNFFGEVMVFGMGETAPTIDDHVLEFEMFRSPITIKDYDLENSRIILGAAIPNDVVFETYEVGIAFDNGNTGEGPNLTAYMSFDDTDDGTWSGGTLEESGRMGPEGYSITVAANESGELVRTDTFIGFEEFNANDEFVLAYDVTDGVPDSIELRFREDASNYRGYSFTPSAGFNVERWKRSDFVETGDAGWDNFTSVEVIVTAGGSPTTVLMEGFRTDKIVAEDPEILVARTVLAEPLVKTEGEEVQFEYTLSMDFTA